MMKDLTKKEELLFAHCACLMLFHVSHYTSRCFGHVTLDLLLSVYIPVCVTSLLSVFTRHSCGFVCVPLLFSRHFIYTEEGLLLDTFVILVLYYICFTDSCVCFYRHFLLTFIVGNGHTNLLFLYGYEFFMKSNLPCFRRKHVFICRCLKR